MATDLWPIDWPESAQVDTLDAETRNLAENYAASTLRLLTLRRVGGRPITVMPCSVSCAHPRFETFHPVLLESGMYANCFCHSGCNCEPVDSVTLEAPVGRIDEVKINGVVLDPINYHVENGHRLVRNDGIRWPSCAGLNFTVTYLRGYPVGPTGRYVAGLLAAEFVKAITGSGKCRLPSNVTSIARQGVTYEMQRGMYPDGFTGIKEVDAFIVQWNPHGTKQSSGVYSIDTPSHRQITWP